MCWRFFLTKQGSRTPIADRDTYAYKYIIILVCLQETTTTTTTPPPRGCTLEFYFFYVLYGHVKWKKTEKPRRCFEIVVF